MAKIKRRLRSRTPDTPGPGLTSKAKAMSEFELALVVLANTFTQWIARCGKAAGIVGLSSLDILVLHFLCNRRRPMRAVDIAFALSIEDIHLVVYSLKKLARVHLVAKQRNGSEILFSATKLAEEAYERYQGI